MLTADHVHARRVKGELRIAPLDGPRRVRARELCEVYLAIARDLVGRTRDDLDEACAAVEVHPAERRLADGIRKLIEDRCTFDAEPAVDPEELRRALFLRAAAARRELPDEASFERGPLIAAIAEERAVPAEAIDHLLYADLRGANILRALDPISADALLEHYDRAQVQAVLLRAVKVVAFVRCASPGAYRALFRKLKFLRLLHTIRAVAADGDGGGEGDGYAIEIDGPMSLFESVTRYGLQLALALPVVAECSSWRLSADLRWGKARERLTFHQAGAGAVTGRKRAERLPDEIQALIDAVRAQGGEWTVAAASVLLDLPGAGLCVPDLEFRHRASGQRVYLEVLGFWSRAAVWRRVELVERGLPEKIVFAVSQRLRVSEAALDDEAAGALYVYKGTMSAKAVLERLERVRAR
ncbi:MAG: DUF790 family protein [Myxococcales bacterium]|nr:DUF790 family protein [Myxococcales bacterium]